MLVGIDVLDVERAKKLVGSEKFLNKYFTEKEIEYIRTTGHSEQTLAGIYSAKEAVLKALGIGIGRGIDLHDIEIDHDVLGKPFLNMISEYGKKMFEDIGATGVDISISHTKDVSTAICVIKN